MQHKTSIAGLKDAIQLLEAEQDANGQLLKEQFYIIVKGLRPANFLMKTLGKLTSSPYLIENILGTSIGLASGFLTKRIVVSTSGNILRKLLGSVLQFGVTNIVARHPGTIKLFGKLILRSIFRKKNVNPPGRTKK